MPSAVCYHLSLSTDRHRGPDEIRLLHTGVKVKPINGNNAKISKDRQTNKIESRKTKQKNKLIKKNKQLFYLICFQHSLDYIAPRKQKAQANA